MQKDGDSPAPGGAKANNAFRSSIRGQRIACSGSSDRLTKAIGKRGWVYHGLVHSLALARPRRNFTAAQRAQSEAFWARKAVKAERAAKAAEATRQRREDQRHRNNADLLRHVGVNPKLQEAVLGRSKSALLNELTSRGGGERASQPMSPSKQQLRAFKAALSARRPVPQPLGRKASLTEAELLRITREAADMSERRLRSFDNYQRALASVPSNEEIDAAQRRADTADAAFAPLMRQHQQLSTGKSARKTTRLRQTKSSYEKAESEAESAKAHVASQRERRSLVKSIHDSMSGQARDAERSAAALWVHGEERQAAPIRTLSDWRVDGVKWRARNRQAGRPLAPGEVLRVKTGWSDAINQGWMQGGYDRGAAFRLLTRVPDQVESMHNRYVRASKPSPVDYDTRLTNWARNHRDTHRQLWSPGPKGTAVTDQHKSFFAQELVNAAGVGYVIHRDAADRQVLMPRAKSDLLHAVRARGQRVTDSGVT